MVTLPRFGVLLALLAAIGVISALMLYSAPLTEAERAARMPRWLGCYRLQLGPFSTGIDISKIPYAPPPTFRLDSTVRHSPLGIPLGFMTATPESPNATHPGAYLPGWDFLGRDSVVVFWGDGFDGTQLALRDSDGSRIGLVELTTDVIGPDALPRAVARAIPIPCEPAGQ
jgi:hypothetical protein